MTLLSPWWLLWLLPVVLLALAYVLQLRRRSRYAVRFASLPMLERLVPRRPRWRRHLPAALLLLAELLSPLQWVAMACVVVASVGSTRSAREPVGPASV